jgi:hypothetical protein
VHRRRLCDRAYKDHRDCPRWRCPFHGFPKPIRSCTAVFQAPTSWVPSSQFLSSRLPVAWFQAPAVWDRSSRLDWALGRRSWKDNLTVFLPWPSFPSFTHCAAKRSLGPHIQVPPACPSIGPGGAGPDGFAERRFASMRGRRSRGYRPRGPDFRHARGSYPRRRWRLQSGPRGHSIDADSGWHMPAANVGLPGRCPGMSARGVPHSSALAPYSS